MPTQALPAGNARELGFDANRLSRINKTMDDAVAQGAIPGTVTIVLRKGQVVHTHATGKLDIERAAPLGMDSLFRMYSQTKPVTAAVVMSLFEEGAFLLNEPLSKWIPEFANPKVVAYPQATDRVRSAVALANVEAARREITIFDLLTMTSGLPSMGRTPVSHAPTFLPAWEGTGFMAADTRINDPRLNYEDMVTQLAKNPLHSHPGDTWNYGSDFDVISLFLTRATGKPLNQIFQERIFGPLGMRDSSFYCAPENLNRLVTDHQWDASLKLVPRDRPETTEKAGRSNRRLESGNGLFGGMLCSPWDYARFAQMLANGGELDGVRILGRKTVELMTANHIGERNVDIAVGPNYGFGFAVCVRKGVEGTYMPGSAGTYGWGGAAGTWFFVDPKEQVVGLFFTHVFGYQFNPMATLFERFEKLTYEALT